MNESFHVRISLAESSSPHFKFPPITQQNRSNYHKSANDSPPPCPQILWIPQTLTEPTINSFNPVYHLFNVNADRLMAYLVELFWKRG